MSLIDKIRKAREREVGLGAHTFTVRRPTDIEAMQLRGASGIADLARPDYGDAVEILPGDMPVYWACGVTPQEAVRAAGLPLVLTHKPGYMLVTDIRNDTLAAF